MVCCKKIGKTQKRFECSTCEKYVHRKLTEKDFENMMYSYECISCRALQLPQINLTDTQFYTFVKHGIHSDEIAERLEINEFQRSILDKLSQMTFYCDEDEDDTELQ